MPATTFTSLAAVIGIAALVLFMLPVPPAAAVMVIAIGLAVLIVLDISLGRSVGAKAEENKK